MQVRPLDRPGPRPPACNVIFHCFGGTSLPDRALDRGLRDQRSKPSLCRPQRARPRPSQRREATAGHRRCRHPELSYLGAQHPARGQNHGTKLVARRLWKMTAKYSCRTSDLKGPEDHLHYKGNPSTTQKPRHRWPHGRSALSACTASHSKSGTIPAPLPGGSGIQDSVFLVAITDSPSGLFFC